MGSDPSRAKSHFPGPDLGSDSAPRLLIKCKPGLASGSGVSTSTCLCEEQFQGVPKEVAPWAFALHRPARPEGFRLSAQEGPRQRRGAQVEAFTSPALNGQRLDPPVPPAAGKHNNGETGRASGRQRLERGRARRSQLHGAAETRAPLGTGAGEVERPLHSDTAAAKPSMQTDRGQAPPLHATCGTQGSWGPWEGGKESGHFHVPEHKGTAEITEPAEAGRRLLVLIKKTSNKSPLLRVCLP